MRISALTPGLNVPSSRYRIRQYIPALNEAGIDVTEFPAKIDYSSKLPGPLGRIKQRYIFPLSAAWIGIKAFSRISDIVKSNNFDAVWLNRIIVNSLFLENFIKKPLIYDVDDSIWINNTKITIKTAQKADVILAGNSFIAEWFSRFNSNVHIIPTAVDTLLFSPSKISTDKLFKIVWTGTSQTIHYLYSIEKALATFLNKRNDCLLIVISDVFPNFKQIKPGKIQFIRWTPENEVDAIREAQIGIMPLRNTLWEKGKCSYKMLKYMACGLPVIVSPVGMNNDVLSKGNIGYSATTEDDWIDSLETSYNKPELNSQLGMNGRQVICDEYSLEVISKLILQIFLNL